MSEDQYEKGKKRQVCIGLLKYIESKLYPPEVETSFRWFPSESQFDLFLSYISPSKSFLPFKLPPGIGFFEASDYLTALMVVDGSGWWWWMGHGRHIVCQKKKQPFQNYLKNFSIFFPNCFCAPQKSLEDIFWNVTNWKNSKFTNKKFLINFVDTKTRVCRMGCLVYFSSLILAAKR